MRTNRLPVLILACALLLVGLLPSLAIGEKEVDDVPATIAEPAPIAQIINDEGGPVILTGELAYTNAFFHQRR